MFIKAKFKCAGITDVTHEHGKNRTVNFHAVYGKDGTDNGDYSKATPSGNLSMQIDESTAAYDYFKPGKNYYLTLEVEGEKVEL